MTREPLDLRLVPLALASWAAAALGQGWDSGRVVLVGTVLVSAAGGCVLVDKRRVGRRAVPAMEPVGDPRPATRASGVTADARRLAHWPTFGMSAPPDAAARRLPAVAALLVVSAGALAGAGLRAASVGVGPVSELARDRATVSVEGRVAGDPIERDGQFGRYVLVRVVVTYVEGRGRQAEVRSPVLVIAESDWMRAEYGERVRAAGRLDLAAGHDLSAVLVARGPPERLEPPSRLDRFVASVRAGINEAAAPLPATERVLVPALVNGDDAGMPEQAVEDFRTTGLTHLLAVSGANVTLVLGFVLVVARWCGVRGRWLTAVGVLAVVFFVLVARPQPSVLRAAAMGVVAIVGLAAGGRARGVRALSLAVLVLVLADPWLARSVGFLLSVLATGGILLLAPAWRNSMSRWMPRPCAEALAVPLAAQAVCTPVVAAISGQVSLVAVLANVLAAPAVGPTTVLGFAGGLVAVVWPAGSHVIGYVAGAFAWWIVAVARHGAALAGAAVDWPVGAVAIAALTLICLVQIAVLGWLLRHRWPCLAVTVLLIAYVLSPPGRPGWPPAGWRVVMCDVGQGDGLVLNAGHGVGVVVDVGPDPALMDRCLERLGVQTVALVLLTHFHADHVDGLAGVLDGRDVAEIEVSPLPDPADRAATVQMLATRAGVPVTVAVPGSVRTIGEVTMRTLGPISVPALGGGYDGEGSAPNNASVVVSATIGGVAMLLAGDSEPEEQQAIFGSGADLVADVLKVAHHGSANQDADFVLATRAAVALVSVGEHNDYGHPAGHLLGLLRELGARVYRTDQQGDVAVVERAGIVAVVPWR